MTVPNPQASRAVLLGSPVGGRALDLPDLPGVRNNHTVLKSLLTDGTVWALDDEHCLDLSDEDNPVRLLRRIGAAAQEATDTLLVYFAGHGLLGGQDDDLFLALPDAERPDECLRYEWLRDRLKEGKAKRTIVILDCCFGGQALALEMSGPSDLAALTDIEGVCVLTASAKTQKALAPVGADHTAFTGVLLDVLREGVAGGSEFLDMATVHRAVEAGLLLLKAEHPRLPSPQLGTRQQGGGIIIGRNHAYSGEEVLAQAAVDAWVLNVREHRAWASVKDPAATTVLRSAAETFVEQLARRHRAARASLGDDPWWDEEFPGRTAERMEFLVGQLGPDLELSAAEASLLVVAPFLNATVTAVERAAALPDGPAASWIEDPTAPGLESFSRFCRGYPRLLRRAAGGADADAPAAIAWWLFGRWVDREAALLPSARTMAGLLPRFEGKAEALVREVFAAERLAALDQVAGIDPELLLATDRPAALKPRVTVRGGTSWEQDVREQLLGFLIMLADGMAIDPSSLGEVLVDHLGIADSIDLDELRACVAASSWQNHGHRSRALRAGCPHPAIEIALRERVEAVRTVLGVVHAWSGSQDSFRSALLPVTVSADEVGAAEIDGRRAYASPGMRFRLADDQVRELLMGEQLYQDRGLAIRELYQNALDACRYRRARTEYLRRMGHDLSEYEGKITFEQGTDEDGRAYLDCADNGIGMGVRELREVFSQAGTRFADLPDFRQEQAEWQALDPPVELFPNSRFGIGVLSYFMLADEIVVTTCRMGRNGMPGRSLEVVISGPGTIFRIRDRGQGGRPGTVVRLYLNPALQAPSCVDLLRRLLWVAEFATTAKHGDQAESWRAGVLSECAPVGTEDPMKPDGKRKVLDVVETAGGQIWWCGGFGALLADGVWAGERVFGFVANLAGANAPRLSIDRRTILDKPWDLIEKMLLRAVGGLALIAPPADSIDVTPGKEWRHIGGYVWLLWLSGRWPNVADAIVSEFMRRADSRWAFGDRTLKLAVLGCFPPDLRVREITFFSKLGSHNHLELGSIPPEVEDWRSAAYVASQLEEVESPSTVAMPSDAALLAHPFLRGLSSTAHVMEVALALGRPLSEVAGRLRELGIEVSPALLGLGYVTREDLRLVDPEGRGVALPWTEPVPAAQVMALSLQLGWSHERVIGRLRELGFDAAHVPDAVGAVTDLDLRMMSWSLNGKWPWLTRGEALWPGHVSWAAAKLDRDVSWVVRRLGQLGFPAGDTKFESMTDEDRRLLSWRLNGTVPWLPQGKPVPLAHVVRAVIELGWSAARVVGRLVELGFSPPTELRAAATASDEDRVLIRQEFGSHESWLNEDVTVPLEHLLRKSVALGWDASRVADRLWQLGFAVPQAAWSLGRISEADLVMASRWLNGSSPFLGAGEPISQGRLVGTAGRMALDLQAARLRYEELGFVVPPAGTGPGDVTTVDVALVSVDGDLSPLGSIDVRDRELWLGSSASLGHVIGTAVKLGWPPHRVAGRLAELGLDVPALPAQVDELTGDDVILAEGDLEAESRWITGPIGPGHLIGTAARLGWTLSRVVRRLTELGFGVDGPVPALSTPDAFDGVLVSRDLDGRSPWLDPAETVGPAQLVRAAARLDRTVEAVADRLRELGFSVTGARASAEPGAWLRAADPEDPDEEFAARERRRRKDRRISKERQRRRGVLGLPELYR